MNYLEFIESKGRLKETPGIMTSLENSSLYPFQVMLTEWALAKGRAAIFADCGMGKTPMQLHWAREVCAFSNGRVLIITPIAVGDQTANEAKKFGIEAHVSRDGKLHEITITNYERLHYFNPKYFSGCVCDESSILKNYAGATRQEITDFLQTIPYRLLCTATPAPNDYMELATSCEALGIMRRVEMLAQFFQHDSGETSKWALKGHAETPFWEFMASWARAVRCPADLGFDDGRFVLPELITDQVTLKSKPLGGALFVSEAVTLDQQRAERRATIDDRCKAVSEIANANNEPFLAWCSLNDESALLAKSINGAVELSGSDSEEEKESKMRGFSDGSIRCLVTKPSIAGFGMNWQHCHQMSFFPSHSHEQYYQAVRRCWRFGQTKPVTVWIVTTEAESAVLANMQRKEAAANQMFSKIVNHMSSHYSRKIGYKTQTKMEAPKWLLSA